MKKIYLMILAVLLAATFCACDLSEYLPVQKPAVETVNPYLRVESDALIYSESYTPVESSYAYQALPLESERALYEKLLDSIYEISPEKAEDVSRYPMPEIELRGYPMTEAQVRTAVKALTDDRPEIFWVTGTLGFYSDDSTTLVQLYSSYSPEEVDARLNALRAVANEFYEAIPEGLSVYGRERAVHDYLIERVEYDKDVDLITPANNDSDIYTVYGALVNRVAVCEGYARSFQLLLNGLGVDCVGLMGKSQDQLHMWNAVKMDGGWYHVDATWDDREESYARYIYFNVDDSFILEDHTLSPMVSDMTDEMINGEEGEFSADVMNLFVPSCTDRTMGYYYRETPHLSDYDGEAVRSGLLAAASAQEPYFLFYIDEALDFNNAVTALFADYPQYFFEYANAANDYLTDFSIDTSNMRYFAHDMSRFVAVELHYY